MDRYISLRDGDGRDLFLYVLALALAMGGLLILYPVSAVVSDRLFDDPSYYMQRQLVWFVLGVIGLFVSSTVPLNLLRKLAAPSLLITLFLLILVFVPGVGKYVASDRESFHRWVGIGPVRFQPSEFAKIAIILYVSATLAGLVGDFKNINYRKLFFPSLLIGLALGAIVLEPQYGTTICILAALVILVYISGFPMLRLFLVFLGITPFLGIAAIMQSYRLERLKVWWDPYAYRYEGGYQLVNSFRAFREGGWLGTELASGPGHRYLTFGHTDFVLALFAEDYGYLGISILLLLFLVFLWRAGVILRRVDDSFVFLLGAGSLSMLYSQIVLNMAVVTGIVPTTGVSLPFISYGGSSLVATMVFAGLLINASRWARNPREAGEIPSSEETT